MSNQDEMAKYLAKEKAKQEENKPAREDLIAMLDEMNASFDRLPIHVQCGYVTQCDLNAALLLIAQILKHDQRSS